MKIIADQNMPLVEILFSQFGDVELLPGRDISRQTIGDAEILLVRSVTEVNRSLLEDSSVRFVGSATAGSDHIDKQYLEDNNIHFAYAPGCNAQAVVEYVLSVICCLCPNWQQRTVGILGCGNVGGRLYQCLQALKISTLVYDPFLDASSNPHLCSFDAVLACDIISVHTPLTKLGAYPTYHLFDSAVLDQIQPSTLLINTSRGAVVDNRALKEKLLEDSSLRVALDVWEAEPQIDPQLLDLVTLATPHIAGYSDEGKIKGTRMLYDAVQALYPHLAKNQGDDAIEPQGSQLALTNTQIAEAILACYRVTNDDYNFRQAVANSGSPVAEVFDKLRKNYPQRREFSHYRVSKTLACSEQLGRLGFSLI